MDVCLSTEPQCLIFISFHFFLFVSFYVWLTYQTSKRRESRQFYYVCVEMIVVLQQKLQAILIIYLVREIQRTFIGYPGNRFSVRHRCHCSRVFSRNEKISDPSVMMALSSATQDVLYTIMSQVGVIKI